MLIALFLVLSNWNKMPSTIEWIQFYSYDRILDSNENYLIHNFY